MRAAEGVAERAVAVRSGTGWPGCGSCSQPDCGMRIAGGLLVAEERVQQGICPASGSSLLELQERARAPRRRGCPGNGSKFSSPAR